MIGKYRSLLWLSLTMITLSAAGQSVTGSGSSGTVPVFTGSSTLGNSPITTTSSGNVGIGTTTPWSPLTVSGTISSTQQGIITDLAYKISSNSSWTNQNLIGHWYTGSQDAISIQVPGYSQNSAQMVMLGNGNVGIATTTPAAKLDIGDASGAGSLETVFARLPEGNGTGDGTYLGVKGWCTQPGSPCGFPSSSILSFSIEHHFYGQTNSSINFYRGGGSSGGFLTFATNNNNEQMRITPSGNVGIGTTNPGSAYKLDVAGNVHTSGSVIFGDGSTQSTAWTGSLCGGDYAESVDVSDDRKQYEPGDVLVIDPKVESKVLKSSEPYSTSVTGIYSTKPGVVGRRQTTPKSADEIPMAMIGIVPTKVSAENGPIRPGDLLVTSSTPGYAMRGTDRNRMLGAVIGKAFGHLDSGTGVIEVAVMLQ